MIREHKVHACYIECILLFFNTPPPLPRDYFGYLFSFWESTSTIVIGFYRIGQHHSSLFLIPQELDFFFYFSTLHISSIYSLNHVVQYLFWDCCMALLMIFRIQFIRHLASLIWHSYNVSFSIFHFKDFTCSPLK